MIHDVSFIAACVELEDFDLNFDWITIKFLHQDIFENLIMRTYRVFFDKSGQDVYSLMHFKNCVIGELIKPEYRQQLVDKIRLLPIEDKFYKSKMNAIRDNLVPLRNQYIGHGMLNPSSNEKVDLVDLKELLENGCELFQTLSFNVEDFYRGTSDGYGFEAEWKYTYSSAKAFIKLSKLSSKYITDVSCKYAKYCPEDVKERIKLVIRELNEKQY